MPTYNGRQDSWFIAEVRRLMRDEPVWYSESLPTDGVKGTIAAGSQPFRLQRAPVFQDPGNQVILRSTLYTIVYDTTPATGQVEIVTETGELIFNGAPASAQNIKIIYRGVRFRDQQILHALRDGMDLLWPELYDYNTSIGDFAFSPTLYEYALPATFRDPRVLLMDVEYAPPSGIIRFFRIGSWRVSPDGQAPTLVFNRLYPPGSQCRLSWAQPYESLGQVATNALFLPIYYAVARLLMDQEVMRLRSDDIQALTGEGASQPGLNTSTADYWFGRFEQALQKLSLDLPARRSVAGRAGERLNLSAFWQVIS
jgi:hypothetical protein